MLETPSGFANDLFNSLKNSFDKNNIPLRNLVGFSSDTTNAMVGEHNSVFSHLKKTIPDIACIKCSCHMIHLAASKACLKLPRSVEDLLRNTGSHFHRSFSRQKKFQEFQEFFKTDIHKMLSTSNTRWLSLKACVDRVLEQYEPLQAYYRELVYEDPSKTTEEMLATMQNKFTLIYLEFMSCTLGLLTDFNLLFQSEGPLLHRLKPEVEKLLKHLCGNYMEPMYIKDNEDILLLAHKNQTFFLKLPQMYLGVAATQSISSLKTEGVSCIELDHFLQTCQLFYNELVSEIKKRFDFSDPLFSIIMVVDPRVAQSFKINSLVPVVNRFPVLKNVIDLQELDNEWRKHSLLNHLEYNLPNSLPTNEYWKRTFELKNVAEIPMFPNLKKVMALLLVLPFSNACVERIFSALKIIKTEHRNNLNTETVSAIINTKNGIMEKGGCLKFSPTKDMLRAKIWQNWQKT